MIGLGFLSLITPRAWLLAGAFVAVAAYTGLVYHAGGIGPRKDLADLREAVEEAAAEQILANQRDAEAREAISNAREADHATRFADLDRRYNAAIAGLRAPGGGGEAPALSEAARFLGCSSRHADAVARLQRFEEGVLSLLKRGDRAIERAATCKAWLDEQAKLK